MIRVTIYVKDIDYQTLIRTFMPYIEKSLTEKENPVSDIISKIVSKNGKPTKFSSFLLSLIPKKDDMVACLLPHFDEVLIQYLNQRMSEYQFFAKVSSLKSDTITRKQETMLRFVVEIEDIDYVATAEHFLPTLIEQLSEKEAFVGRIGTLLLGQKELMIDMIKGAINAVSPMQRDDFVVTVLKDIKDDLRKYMNQLIYKNQIKAEIRALRFERIESDD